jgi:hypothetical protein
MFEIFNEIPSIWRMLGAALAGSVIAQRFRTTMKWRIFWFSAVSGLIITLCIGEILTDILGGAQYSAAVGFCIGLFGLTIVDTAHNLIRTMDWEIATKIIKTIRGGGE